MKLQFQFWVLHFFLLLSILRFSMSNVQCSPGIRHHSYNTLGKSFHLVSLHNMPCFEGSGIGRGKNRSYEDVYGPVSEVPISWWSVILSCRKQPFHVSKYQTYFFIVLIIFNLYIYFSILTFFVSCINIRNAYFINFI